MDRQDIFKRKGINLNFTLLLIFLAALDLLSENLKSSPTIDCLIAGILISKDYSKTLSVLE